MPSNNAFEQLVLYYLPKCPLCKSDEGYKLLGFNMRERFECRNCKAQWKYTVVGFTGGRIDWLKLKKPSRNGRGKQFTKEQYPIRFWRECMNTEDYEVFVKKKEREQEIEALLKELNANSSRNSYSNPKKRLATKQKLRDIGEPVFSMLNQTLKMLQAEPLVHHDTNGKQLLDYDILGQERVIKAFGDLEDEKGIEPLTNIVRNSKFEGLRLSAIDSLLQIERATKTGKALEQVLWALKHDEDVSVRIKTARALGDIKNNGKIIDALIIALNDVGRLKWSRKDFLGNDLYGYNTVQKEAASSILKIGDKKGVTDAILQIATMLTPQYLYKNAIDFPLKFTIHDFHGLHVNSSVHYRNEALETIRILRKSIPQEQMEALVSKKDEINWWIATNQWQKIEQIDESNVEALIPALMDPNDDVRAKTAETLRKLGYQKGIDAIKEAERLLRTLEVQKLEDWNAHFIQALNSPASEDKWVTSSPTLGTVLSGDSEASENLARSNSDSKIGIILKLKAIGNFKSIEPLIKVLKNDADSRVRKEAADALVGIVDYSHSEFEWVLGPLTHALENDVEEVRQRIVACLADLKDPLAIDLLTQATKDKALLVRHAAKKALERIQKKE